MKKNITNFSFLILSLIIGTLIIFAPVIITGQGYDIQRTLGGLLIAEFLMRTTAIIVGLLVIYHAIKTIIIKE
ncbi:MULTISPECIES: hypothetical protein [Paraliobacillus]|uniref:hypothetical protein n=1 Tax=Paraliobacillus TaxID=200903 RepID=UPI000DD43F80|nr:MULTISPECIES: hypothetical protein [Paraliobacillus]